MLDTFSAVYNAVLDRVRSLRTDSDYVALAQSYVNARHKELLAWKPWPFLQKSGALSLTPPVVTGTVAGTQATTTITGTGTAFTSSHIGWYLKIGSAQELYRVTAVASGTSITITPSLILENFTGQSYKLFALTYSLPADFRQPEEVDNFIAFPPMRFLGHREFRRKMSSPQFGIPEYWTLFWEATQTAAATPTIAFYPFADDYRQIQYDYTILITDLSGDGDAILVPDPYREVLVEGAVERFYRDVLDDPEKADRALGMMTRLREQMVGDYGFFDDQPQFVPHDYRKKKDLFDDEIVIDRMRWTQIGA